MSEGFLDRWSRRKQLAREGEPLPPEPPPPALQAPPPTEPERPPDPPPPTLEDAEALTPESDFKPFVARNVAPEVRNTALKKLFADPHFNAMDGLDVYIDDYSKPSPLPPEMLRRMASAQFLKLFDDEQAEGAKESPHPAPAQDVAQCSPSGDSGDLPSPPAAYTAQPASQETDDHHADLRLQQDDAARSGDDRGGPG